MKKLNLLFFSLVMFVVFTTTGCSQPKSEYEVSWNSTNEATSYTVFLEERTTSSGFNLISDIDYLNPNVSNLILTSTSDTSVVLQLNNDGKYLVVGVVAFNISGFYSPMAVSEVYQKGRVPTKPSLIIIRKR